MDINDPIWVGGVEYEFREQCFQSFAFHREFGQPESPGYGRFYTWCDVRDNQTPAEFRPGGGSNTHHTVLHEWIANDDSADYYDGDAPRELMRFEQPASNHNGGLIAFNQFSNPGDSDYGYLYISVADGGRGADPLNLALNLGSAFGKILRIDPLGSDSQNGQYGIPPDNSFVGDEHTNALGEIYAYGMRNPQRFGWDPANGNLFMADIGQNIVEKVSLVPRGGNLGWSNWEGSYRFISRSKVALDNPRSNPDITYPVVEYGRYDPLMDHMVAVTSVHIFRSDVIPQLRDRILFADMVNGELLHFDANNLPKGGTEGIRRMLLRGSNEEVKTCLELIQEKKGSRVVHRHLVPISVSEPDLTDRSFF